MLDGLQEFLCGSLPKERDSHITEDGLCVPCLAVCQEITQIWSISHSLFQLQAVSLLLGSQHALQCIFFLFFFFFLIFCGTGV
jgi:hypothetical protein